MKVKVEVTLDIDEEAWQETYWPVDGVREDVEHYSSVVLTNYFADHYSQKYHVHRLHRDAVH